LQRDRWLLGAAIGLLMWMWLSGIAVLAGAQLDCSIKNGISGRGLARLCEARPGLEAGAPAFRCQSLVHPRLDRANRPVLS
jgi:hypothetical protein